MIEAQYKSKNEENTINEKEVKIYKYQRIYYNDRRKRKAKKEKTQEKEKKDIGDRVEIYSSNKNLNVVN